MPSTRQSGSTTVRGLDAGPIRHVPAACWESKQLARIQSSSASPAGGASTIPCTIRIGLPNPQYRRLAELQDGARTRATVECRRACESDRARRTASGSARRGSVSGFGEVMRRRPREYVWYAVIQMKPCDRLMPIRFIAIRNMSFSPAPAEARAVPDGAVSVSRVFSRGARRGFERHTHREHRMVDQIIADRQVRDDADSDRAQIVGGTDA